MGALIVVGFVLIALGLFDYLALTRGVDSRPDFAAGRMPFGIPTR
jgi:hypothetical protein